jgi:hypothetical protein
VSLVGNLFGLGAKKRPFPSGRVRFFLDAKNASLSFWSVPLIWHQMMALEDTFHGSESTSSIRSLLSGL